MLMVSGPGFMILVDFPGTDYYWCSWWFRFSGLTSQCYILCPLILWCCCSIVEMTSDKCNFDVKYGVRHHIRWEWCWHCIMCTGVHTNIPPNGQHVCNYKSTVALYCIMLYWPDKGNYEITMWWQAVYTPGESELADNLKHMHGRNTPKEKNLTRKVKCKSSTLNWHLGGIIPGR